MTTEVDPLATSKTVVDLQWHIVSGTMENEELLSRSKIREWHPKKDRHSLFMSMKYPGHRFYKGSWGPELLHHVDEGYLRGGVGKVHCTYDRYKEIANWFLRNMFDA